MEQENDNDWDYEVKDSFDGQSWVAAMTAMAADRMGVEFDTPAKGKVVFNEGTTTERKKELLIELESILKSIVKL